MSAPNRLVAALAWAILALGANQARAQTVDLELVLAVDASSSVNYEEFQLQMGGLARAFRHPAVIDAIRAGAPNGLGVTLLQWSSEVAQSQVVNWRIVRTPADSLALADAIDAGSRRVVGGATAIAPALNVAIEMLETNAIEGARRVIDVSGDGRSNEGGPTYFARARAVALGITINGLAILNEEPNLDAYYLAAVIGGNGSFLLTADDFNDFARAIRQKLITEITGAPIVERAPGGERPENPVRIAAATDPRDRAGRSSRPPVR